MSNTVKLNIAKEEIFNLITSLDFIKDELQKIDVPDFDCDAFTLINDCSIIQTLRDSI